MGAILGALVAHGGRAIYRRQLAPLLIVLCLVGVSGCAERRAELRMESEQEREREGRAYRPGELKTGLRAIVVPAPGGGPRPADKRAAYFLHYRAPGAFSFRNNAGETSLGINPRTNTAMFQMVLDTARVRWDDSTSPATSTWDNVSYVLTSKETLDPILWTDRTTGRTFVTQLAGPGALLAYTDDDGAHWTLGAPPVSAPSIDHETVGGGPYAQPAPLGAALGYPNAVYYCAQGIAVSQCARSDNGGQTWGPPFVMDNASECSTIHGHVVVGPDGSVLVPKRRCTTSDSTGQGVRFSRDNGVTWKTAIVPGAAGRFRSDPAIAFDAGGRAYFAGSNDGTPVAAFSTDSGAGWSRAVDIGKPFGLKNIEFPMVVAGDPGRAAVAFYASPKTGDDQVVKFDGDWHLYVAFTYDGGLTWTTTDTTPDDPVQRGCIWLGGGTNPCRNLYDFQGITMDAEGRVLIGYADGCANKVCVAPNGKPEDSRDSWGTIARQSGGKRLVARFDP